MWLWLGIAQQWRVANVPQAVIERVLALLKRHATQATSFQILEPGYQYWFSDDGHACIAYAIVLGARVTVGEPVAAPDAMADAALAFVADAERAGERVRFFHVSEDFVARTGLASTHVGEQPEWDPAEWANTLKSTRSLREQLRRARSKGVTTRVLSAQAIDDVHGPERLRVDALIQRWLTARGMHELKFMVLVHPFSFPYERRYVIAERNGELVGFAAAVPVYARRGWFVEDLVRDPHAPNGTAETLVDAMMQAFGAEGVRYAALGLSPLTGDVSPLLAFTRDTTARLYNFGGVRAFKEKLKPQVWRPVYLAYPRPEHGALALRDVLAAFAPGGLVRFGLNTLIHQRSLVTSALGILLVPWTLALAFIDTGKWFPSAAIQQAWTAFDVLLIGLLFALVWRWRPRLAVTAMWLTTFDAVLTTAQFLWWNIFTAQTALEWVFVALGCTGPMIASLFFWTTRVVSLRMRLAVGQSTDSARG